MPAKLKKVMALTFRVAHIRYLQEKHCPLLVQGQFNPEVVRLYRTLQKNTPGLAPKSLDLLEKATTIYWQPTFGAKTFEVGEQDTRDDQTIIAHVEANVISFRLLGFTVIGIITVFPTLSPVQTCVRRRIDQAHIHVCMHSKRLFYLLYMICRPSYSCAFLHRPWVYIKCCISCW